MQKKRPDIHRLEAPVPSVGVGAPEQHFAFATAHDGDVAASSVIAILEAEDKQKTNDQEENRKTPLTKKKIVEARFIHFGSL